jgi:hypothetical protein
VGVADFNGDGHPDYLLFNSSTRQTAIWYLNNNVLTTGLLGPTLPVGWTVVGVADFNGDGKPDYALYSSATQRTAIWYLNNNAFTNGAYGPTLPSGWGLAAVGDFNADSKPDYVLSQHGVRTTFASGLSYPYALAFDSAGNLFVTEPSSGGGHIDKFTPNGTRSTFAELGEPLGLAFDSAGNLFVADGDSGNIYKFTPGGARTIFAKIPGLVLDQTGFLAFQPNE